VTCVLTTAEIANAVEHARFGTSPHRAPESR
jgi:hypothetical protein